MNKEELEAQGYQHVRMLPDGTYAATLELLFTRAICTGLTWQGWAYRWCFADRELAVRELEKLQAMDDAPTGWVARR